MSKENLASSKISRTVTGSIVHSVDQDEVEQFVAHINEVMKGDVDMGKRLPLDEKNENALFEESRDGLLLR